MIKLERKNWKRTTLGEVASEYSKRVDNPSKSGFDKFIGSENIGRFDYSLKSWQPASDVISGMKQFEIGDYLLVRRSLYASDFRERAPKADIEGICSGDILTIKEKKDKVADGFLYCVLNSKDIWEYIVANASGSITRRIKWNELSKFSFNLPPPKQQIQIAELFQSIENAIGQAEQQEKNLLKLKKSLSNGLLNKEPEFGNLLNKKNCTPTNFSGVADCIEQHDKQKKDVSRFVGLENIEPEDLKISTWGDIATGTTFTKRFSKGDVLFGKRRAYLKKVAVADFDGICSGDILVLRAKEKMMLPELLPYYASAEPFIQQAVTTSAGSLSPRTKWRDLSSFEIAVPELKAQEKIVEVFQQLQTTLEQIKTQIQTLKDLKQKLLNEILVC